MAFKMKVVVIQNRDIFNKRKDGPLRFVRKVIRSFFVSF